MAHDRVAKRVSSGGHNIPIDVIDRRYYRGIKNLINLYIPICDKWLVMNKVDQTSKIIAEGPTQFGEVIINNDIWQTILMQGNDSSN
jgi:predicted ABC-type ATPase